MKKIAFISLLHLSTLAWAGDGNLRCRELDLALVQSRLVHLAQPLYVESKNKVIRLVEQSKNEPDLNASCKALTLARDILARLDGPRVLQSQKPDPMNYVERFSKCNEPKSIRKKIDKFLKTSERNLYPKARIQVRSLLKQGESLSATNKQNACALYDEVRNYILDLWPNLASKLR